jgi:hypothetical protein
MILLDAKEVVFAEIEFQGKPALHSEMRIERSSIPKCLHLYEVRHADDDWSTPVQVAKRVMVNFYGSLITTEPLKIPEFGIQLKEPYDFYKSEARTLDEFLMHHHIKPRQKTAHER